MTQEIDAATAAKRKAQNVRKQRERDIKRKRGLISVTCWIKPKNKETLKEIERRLQ